MLVTLLARQREEGARNALKALQNYCNQWKPEVSAGKTKVVVSGEGRKE